MVNIKKPRGLKGYRVGAYEHLYIISVFSVMVSLFHVFHKFLSIVKISRIIKTLNERISHCSIVYFLCNDSVNIQ